MAQNLLFLLDSDQGAFDSLIRGFFAGIIRFLYDWMSSLIEIMYQFAGDDLGFGSTFKVIESKIFNILLIFMVFKLSLSIITYIVDPDSFTDKSKGVQNIIKRVLISVILLISINPIFTLLDEIQSILINDSVIENIVLGTENDYTYVNSSGSRMYMVKMSDYCDKIDPNFRTITSSKGDYIALLTLRPFIQPVPDDVGDYSERLEIFKSNGYCGIDPEGLEYIDSGDENQILVADTGVPSTASGFLRHDIYNQFTGGAWEGGLLENNVYIIEFDYIFALVVGIVECLILITFCFDVIIRSLELNLLQILAPSPIISYISPKGKSSDMLGTWFKKVMATWASLFIKILALSLAIVIIAGFCDELNNTSYGFLAQVIVILGALMFAKKLPKLIEEIIPGMKLGGGFELNPFKRIQKDALGGNLALGAGAAVAAAGLGGATNALHRGAGLFNKKNYMNKDGNVTAKSALSGFGRTLGRTAGSTIAGAARSGVNAFGRASKDGKIIGGMWNGYQTAMYSKIQREDNLRKAGLENASMGERIQFAAGSAVSDAARYVGVLNKGQREYLQASELDNKIKEFENEKVKLAMQKHKDLEPYVEYSTYASKIKDKIDNESNVKLAKQMLEDAQASGNDQDIMAARQILEKAEVDAGKKLLRDDDEVKAYTRRLDEIRKSCTELQNAKYNYINSNGEFSKGAIYNTKSEANVLEMKYAVKEKGYDVEIDKIKNSREYHESHDENSIAKIQNASRMNKEPQPPGLKPSASPMQSKMTDSSQYSNLDD